MGNVKTNSKGAGLKINQAKIQTFKLFPGEHVVKNQIVNYMKGINPFKPQPLERSSQAEEAIVNAFYLDNFTTFTAYKNNASYAHFYPLSLTNAEDWEEKSYSYLSFNSIYNVPFVYSLGDKSFVAIIAYRGSSNPYARTSLYKVTLDDDNKFNSSNTNTYRAIEFYHMGSHTSYYPNGSMINFNLFEGTRIGVGATAPYYSTDTYRVLRCVNLDTMSVEQPLMTATAHLDCCEFVSLDSHNMLFAQGKDNGTIEVNILTRDSKNSLTLSITGQVIDYSSIGSSFKMLSIRGVKLSDTVVLLVTETLSSTTIYTHASYLSVNLSGNIINLVSTTLLDTKSAVSYATNVATLAFTKKESNKFTLLYTSNDYKSTSNTDFCTDFLAIEVTTSGIVRHQKTSGPVGFCSRPIGYLALQPGNRDRRGVMEIDYDKLFSCLLYMSVKKSSSTGYVNSPNNVMITSEPTKSGIAGISAEDGQNNIQLVTQGTSEIIL